VQGTDAPLIESLERGSRDCRPGTQSRGPPQVAREGARSRSAPPGKPAAPPRFLGQLNSMPLAKIQYRSRSDLKRNGGVKSARERPIRCRPICRPPRRGPRAARRETRRRSFREVGRPGPGRAGRRLRPSRRGAYGACERPASGLGERSEVRSRPRRGPRRDRGSRSGARVPRWSLRLSEKLLGARKLGGHPGGSARIVLCAGLLRAQHTYEGTVFLARGRREQMAGGMVLRAGVVRCCDKLLPRPCDSRKRP